MHYNPKYSLIFGTKIQIDNFVHFSEKGIFEHNLRVANSVVFLEWFSLYLSSGLECLMSNDLLYLSCN